MSATFTNTIPEVGDTVQPEGVAQEWHVDEIVVRGHLGHVVAHLSRVNATAALYNVPVNLLTIIRKGTPAPVTTTPAPGLTPHEVDTLQNVQRLIGHANAKKGFHEEGDALRAAPLGTHDAALRTYYGEKLLLIVSEVTEAHDELRAGRGVTETYYLYEDGSDAQPNGTRPASIDPLGRPRKPEGVPSELADVVVRCFDLAAEAGIDLAGIIDEKLRYNATRPFKHGKKF